MKVFLHLPYSHNGYREQFAYTILESLSSGVPVIVSNNGSIPGIYGDAPNLFLVKEGIDSLKDVRYYLEKILYEYTQEEKEKRSQNGRRWVKENYSLEAISEKYMKEFEKISRG